MKDFKPVSLAVLFLAGIVLLSGCLWTPEFSQVAGELQKQLPDARFKKVLQLSLGPGSLGLARTVLGATGDRDALEVRDYLSDVRTVRVGVYETLRLGGPVDQLRMPRHVRRLARRSGWEQVVKVRQENEYVVALLRRHRETISELFVLTLDRENLVMVQATGRLDRIFQRVMRDHTDLETLFTTR